MINSKGICEILEVTELNTTEPIRSGSKGSIRTTLRVVKEPLKKSQSINKLASSSKH